MENHSLKNNWVEHEVCTAWELEKDMGRDVLCPVALDDSWKDSPWEAGAGGATMANTLQINNGIL